jgi:hypothetical protein
MEILMLAFRSIQKTLLFLLFVLASTSHANLRPDFIYCPTLEALHQAYSLMNKVECYEGKCRVGSEENAWSVDGRDWSLMTASTIQTSSEEEAIAIAQKRMTDASVVYFEITSAGFMGYLCMYLVPSSDIEGNAISIIATSVPEDRLKMLKFLLK